MPEHQKKSGPEIRVVGNVSAEEKEDLRLTYRDLEEDKHLGFLSPEQETLLKHLEYQKTPEELALAGAADEAVNKLLKEAGVSPYEFPAKNLRIYPPDEYGKITGQRETKAESFPRHQLAVFNAAVMRRSPLIFATSAFHENFHLKGHYTVQAEEAGEGEIVQAPIRSGIVSESTLKQDRRKEPHSHFSGLDEAVVSTAERKFTREILEHPALKDEKEWLSSPEAAALKEKIAAGSSISADEIIWVSRDGKDFETSGYAFQRKAYDYLRSEILAQFPGKFKSADDVHKEFVRASFTGKLLGVGKLVEATFGRGSFEVLGMMSASHRNLSINVLHYLRRARARRKHSS